MKISDIPREKVPWYPTIDEGKCTGCGTCVDFCSHGTFELDEAKGIAKVAHPFNCIVGCSNCQSQCPTGAISHPPLSILRELTKSDEDDGPCGCGGCNCR